MYALLLYRSSANHLHQDVSKYSLDFLDSLDVKVPDVGAVEVVVFPVEAASERVPEALRADLAPPTCYSIQFNSSK